MFREHVILGRGGNNEADIQQRDAGKQFETLGFLIAGEINFTPNLKAFDLAVLPGGVQLRIYRSVIDISVRMRVG